MRFSCPRSIHGHKCDCITTGKKVSDCIPTVIMPGLYSDCNCPILNTVGILYQNSIIVKALTKVRVQAFLLFTSTVAAQRNRVEGGL